MFNSEFNSEIFFDYVWFIYLAFGYIYIQITIVFTCKNTKNTKNVRNI